MTRIKELSEREKKAFRRLRTAFRRALLGVMKRKGSHEEMKRAMTRIMQHAVNIGWLEAPRAKTEKT